MVAIVGTVVLGILTDAGFGADHVEGGNHGESRLGTEVIAMALISIGIALIDLGHVTGLLIAEN